MKPSDITWKATMVIWALMLVMFFLGGAFSFVVKANFHNGYQNDRNQAPYWNVEYNDSIFDDMRQDYQKEVLDRNFDEVLYCMYGEINRSGVHIQHVNKSPNMYASEEVYDGKYGKQVMDKVNGKCPKPAYGRGSVKNPVKFWNRIKLDIGVKADYQFLGKCHSHPYTNSHRMSVPDYMNWDAPLSCIMYREHPFIYTQENPRESIGDIDIKQYYRD